MRPMVNLQMGHGWKGAHANAVALTEYLGEKKSLRERNAQDSGIGMIAQICLSYIIDMTGREAGKGAE